MARIRDHIRVCSAIITVCHLVVTLGMDPVSALSTAEWVSSP